MALNFTGFKQKLFSLMKKNETENKAYQLSYAGGNSGYSYGWVQFDLASGPKIGKDKFATILKNATDSNGNKIIPSDQEETLFKAARTKGGTGLTSQQITLITAALSSDYGKTAIDSATSQYFDELITYAGSWVTKAPANDKAFLESDLGKLWLCDVKNQGFVPVTSAPDQFNAFLQGQEYRGYTKQGTLSFDDILQIYFRQRQAANFEPWDPFRRLANVVAATGGYTPDSLDEAKGVIRAYTYYYVSNESRLMQSQEYLNSVMAFRNSVNAPAEQMILAGN